MWKRVKLRILKAIYRCLIVNVTFMDKASLPLYYRVKEFCTLELPSNKGVFTFVFKEDRRSLFKKGNKRRFLLSSYFVELILPEALKDNPTKLANQVAIIVKFKCLSINYEALAHILLDKYISKASLV